MTFGERFYHWNHWYDGLPQEWRFQLVLWPLIALGAINVLLTVSTRFPFGLLLLLGILLVTAIRVPYMLDPTVSAGGVVPPDADRPAFQISNADWLIDLNQRYDAMPESRRFWVLPGVLMVAGAINMLLTIGNRFPFGVLFLLALLVMVAIRAPYVAGRLRPSAPAAQDPVEPPPVDTVVDVSPASETPEADGHTPAL